MPCINVWIFPHRPAPPTPGQTNGITELVGRFQVSKKKSLLTKKIKFCHLLNVIANLYNFCGTYGTVFEVVCVCGVCVHTMEVKGDQKDSKVYQHSSEKKSADKSHTCLKQHDWVNDRIIYIFPILVIYTFNRWFLTPAKGLCLWSKVVRGRVLFKCSSSSVTDLVQLVLNICLYHCVFNYILNLIF